MLHLQNDKNESLMSLKYEQLKNKSQTGKEHDAPEQHLQEKTSSLVVAFYP